MPIYDKIPVDELKRLTNRCIGKLLENLGDAVSPIIQKEIKHQIRQFEDNIRNNILSIGNNHGNSSK